MSDIPLIPPQSPLNTGKPTAGLEVDPAQKFQLGQILTAKVLRVYSDGGYLVDIGGRQHVVDSAIPLRQGEVLRGKVVGLGERTILEKMVGENVSSSPEAEAPVQLNWLDKNFAEDVKAFVARHQAVFDAPAWNSLLRAAGQTKHPQTVLSAAVFLQKLGLGFAPELAVGLARYLAAEAHMSLPVKQDALHLQMAAAAQVSAQPVINATQLIADYLKQKTETVADDLRESLGELKQQQPELARRIKSVAFPVEGNSQYLSDQAAFQLLMNAQTGGAVSHRLVVVPFVLDGRLVEIEMAVFDQKDDAGINSKLKSKTIRLSLDMEHLGKVDAAISVVNQNLRIHVTSDSESGLQMLSTHNQNLAKQLEQLDYRVDELRYATDSRTAGLGVAAPIVELVVNADSLSMLV